MVGKLYLDKAVKITKDKKFGKTRFLKKPANLVCPMQCLSKAVLGNSAKFNKLSLVT